MFNHHPGPYRQRPAKAGRESPGAIGAAIRHARRRLCARLAAMTDSASTPDTCFAHDFPVAVARVEAIFRHEEMVMESLGYARLHAHLAENAVILAALHRALPLVEDGDIALGRQLAAALVDLLSLHRLSTDLTLATAKAKAPQHVAGRPGGRVPRSLLHGGAQAGSRSRLH